LLAPAVLILGACGSSSTDSSTSTAAAGSGGPSGKTAVLVTFGDNTPWGAAANKGIVDGLEKNGIKMLATLPDPDDAVIQAKHMNQAIALKPDILLVAPDDANAIVPQIKRASAAGIKVIVFNSPAAAGASSSIISTVMANNTLLGTFAGETLVAGLQKAGYKSGNVMHITGTNSMTIVQQRIAAFNAVMAKHPEYKVVATEDSNWDPGKSGQIANSLLAKYKSSGGIQGAYGTADYMALGIVSAAKQAGVTAGTKPGNLVVVGSNCTGPGVQAVIDGILAGDATQVPQEQADLLVNSVVDYFNGKTLAKLIQFTPVKITPENAKDYLKTCTY